MIELENPTLTTTHVNTAVLSDQPKPKHFRIKLSLPGKDIGGEWLCRLTGAALAYQNYCGTHGTPRVFSWNVLGDGLSYLKDQEGNWLSWETTANCLYMSSRAYAAAWKIEGGRLIRVSDNAVVTWKEHQRWPFADEHFLQALPASAEALTVEEVGADTPMDRILEKMIAVFSKQHKYADTNDLDRYQYSTNPAPFVAAGGENDPTDSITRHMYQEGKLALFAVTGEVTGETTVPVYLLQRWSQQERRNYFKLSLKTEEDGYTEDKSGKVPGPRFHAFANAQDRPYLGQVYAHSAATDTPGLLRYVYDFVAEEHDGWSVGVPIFRAVTPKVGEDALVGSIPGQSAREYAMEWISKHGDAISQLLKGRGKSDVNQPLVNQLGQIFTGMPPVKYYTLGAGAHGGYGFGTAGVEMGSIWHSQDFGQVPMHEPLSDYSVEWITFGGATGLDIGGSGDVLAIGTWFGDISQIDGACNGITISGQFVAGVSVTLMWDGSWKGANYSGHPIGVTAVVAVGAEAGGGVFYNASATQFWNRRKDFPKT